MVQYISPEQAPERPFLVRGDGLLDLCLGLSLVVFAIGVTLRISWLAIALPTFIISLWFIVDRVLQPQQPAAARPHGWRKRRLLIIPLWLFVLAVLVFVWLLANSLAIDRLPRWVVVLLATYHLFSGGALLAAFLASGGVLSGHGRYFIYALLTLLLFAVLDHAGTTVQTALFALGLILSGGGGLVLLRSG